MKQRIDLSRFKEAQERTYQSAIQEIQNGQKISHWMWFIFPQVHGLGKSDTSQFYAIHDLAEATAFIQDPYLGRNMLDICRVLLMLNTNNATEVFGKPDDMKLKSSMTLFSLVPDTDPVFQCVLDKFFDGKRDTRTMKILRTK